MTPPNTFLLRPSLPIIGQDMPPLEEADEARVVEQAARLRRNNRDFDLWEGFGGNVRCGAAEGPAVFYEDYSPLALYAGFGQEYRALALAGAGDVVLVSEPRQPAFEAYCRDGLQLGDVTIASVTARRRTNRQSLSIQACDDAPVFTALCTRARGAGMLTIMPYMGTGGSWLLASRIARQTGLPVHVAAPPPRLTRLVNDKIWFARQVRALLGDEAVPPTFAVYGMAALVSRLRRLARNSRRVVVKVPGSAGGMGNLALLSEDVLRLEPAQLVRQIETVFVGRGWARTYPLVTGVWETAVLDNQSVQLWIPLNGDGPPIVEGVFSQTVDLESGEFLGVVPADLPAQIRLRLAEEARLIARLWQHLGYFGRCSFDAVLAGDSPGVARLRWIECNGRWGGASVPMTLANRLRSDWSRGGFVAFHVRGPADGPLADVAGTLARLDDLLLVPGRRDEGVVLVVPTLTPRGAGMNFLALAGSHAQAAALRAQVRCLTGN